MLTKNSRRLTGLIIGCSLSVSIFTTPVQAQQSAETYVKLGQKQYSQGNFKEAAASFRLAIYQGQKSASTWLYLAQSYDGAGDAGAARQTYQTIQKYFPNTPECTRATERLAKLQPASPAPQVTVATATGATPTGTSQNDAPKRLKERIFIIPPQFGHPAVAPNTVQLVRTSLAGMPKPVYKILDQGGTNIFITPNLIDKFPKAVGCINEHLGKYFAQEHGRTYSRDVYLCERVAAGNGSGTELGPIVSDENLKVFFYTFVAHALNDCLEVPSNDPQFLAMYKQDYANLDTSDPNLHAFIAPVEGVHDTFAALCASIMGSTDGVNEYCSKQFPRCRAWIAQRIKILSDSKP